MGQFLHGATRETLDAILRQQLNLLRHRGPDGSGIFIDEVVALGHVRLSILDFEGGAQPFRSSDGRFAITYNGEIYNHEELREELRSKGHHFVSRSDTEVLLCGYRQWGYEVLGKINGMFSFVIYDREKSSLFCARDPYGQKPLFYFLRGKTFHFSSEPRAFRAVEGFSRKVNRESLKDFLRFEAFYADASIFEGVKKLPPGHFLELRAGDFRIERYFSDVPKSRTRSLEDEIEEVDAALVDAVRIAFRADVPVGVLLSGGLDSSLVLALLRETVSADRVSAFHVRVGGDRSYDESSFAKEVARHCATPYLEFELSLREMGKIASDLLARTDEPQADPGIVPKYFVCSQIRNHGKVALTGDGGDEFFYGYVVFKAQFLARFYQHVPEFLHRHLFLPLAARLPVGSSYMSPAFLAKSFLKGFSGSEALRNARWTGSFSQVELSQCLVESPIPEDSSEAENFLMQVHRESPATDDLARLAYLYQKTYLPDYVLCNSDRASMLQSVELRAPFLDPRVTRLANAMPSSHKMRGLQTKSFLKRLALRRLPRHLVYRRKQGFTIPAADLLRGDLQVELREFFSESFLRKQALFRYEFVTKLLERHFSGRENLYKPIWTLFALQKWLVENDRC